MAQGITCRTCSGTGVIVRWYTDRKGVRRSEETVCTDCDGTGTVYPSGN